MHGGNARFTNKLGIAQFQEVVMFTRNRDVLLAAHPAVSLDSEQYVSCSGNHFQEMIANIIK